MNYRMTVYMMGIIAVVEGALMLIPFFIGVGLGENTVLAFGVTIAALLAFGIPVVIFKPKNTELQAKEGFVIVALSWILLSVFGAIPFRVSGAIPNFMDALFETVSGFSTTGATILSDIEAMPKSLLFWRSFTHWLGGMGVLVFVIAVIPKADGKIIHVFRAESPGPQVGKMVSKLRFTARILYGIYVAMTLLEMILLLCGGMSFFDSVLNAFATAGTGGFAPKNASIAAYDSLYTEVVITIFMLLFSVNFNLYYLILVGKAKQAVKSEELRVFLGIVLVSMIAITVSLTVSNVYATFGESLRYGSFQVASILSTTGYATADYTTWPLITQFILFSLMLIGGCAGSTGGGLKVSRVMILFKSSIREIKKAISPRSVVSVHLDGKQLDESVSRGVASYFGLYMLLIAASILLISIPNTFASDSTGFLTNATAVFTCVNNVGPGYGAIGPSGNFAGFSIFAKIILCFDMLLGRLEILPMLLLFNFKIWRKA